MAEKTTRTQATCCICQDYREKGVFNKWYTPTPTERRTYHFEKVKLSHTYCPTCYILHMREDGFPDSEIEKMVKDAEAIK
jgi:hypothetical protein